MQIAEEKFLVVNEAAVELAVIGVRLLRTQSRERYSTLVGNALFDCGLRLKASGTRCAAPVPSSDVITNKVHTHTDCIAKSHKQQFVLF